MNARWQSDPVYAADDVIGKLRQHGVKLPSRFADLYGTFTGINIPAEPDADAAANAIADGQAPSAVEELIRAQLFTPALRAASARAKHIAAQRVLHALSKHAEHVHEQLRPIGESLISDIEQAAQIGNISLTELVRTGRHEDAHRYAELSSNLTRLSDLYRLRNAVWNVTQLDVNGVDCSEFHDLISFTSPVRLSDRDNDAAKQHSLWSRGARRWFPTPAEWHARAQQLLPDHQAHQDAINAAQARDRRASFA
jgi:hypothetical protein